MRDTMNLGAMPNPMILLRLLLRMVVIFTIPAIAAEIHDATNHEDLPRLNALLARDVTLVKARDKAGNQPLHLAAMKGNVGVMKALLDVGADVNAKGFDDWTPLHYAAKSRSAKACTLLLERGADKMALNGVHLTPLQVAQGDAANTIRDYTPKIEGMDKVEKAIAANDVTALKALISSNPVLINGRNTKGFSPLLTAVNSGADLVIIKALLEAGADIRATDKSGHSVLSWATYSANADLVDLLFQFKVEPSQAGEFDQLLMKACDEVDWLQVWKVLHGSGAKDKPEEAKDRKMLWAEVKKHPASLERVGSLRRIAAMLVDHGANLNAVSPSADTALKSAAINATPDALKFLLDRGAKPNQKEAKEQALSLAISMERQENVELLLEADADPLFVDGDGEQVSALDRACMLGDPKLVKRLLGCLNDSSRLGSESGPLLAASMSGSIEIVRLLLKHGADARGRDKNGNSAFIYAMVPDATGVIAELIAAGADVNATCKIGFTPLACAAEHNRVGAMKLLLAQGAILEAKNVVGQTPLMFAAGAGAVEAAELLLKVGANAKAVDAKGETAMSLAAATGRTSIIRLLLDAGLPVNGESGGSPVPPLHIVAMGRNMYAKIVSSAPGAINGITFAYVEPGSDADYLAAAEMLIARGADVNAFSKQGLTSLHAAAVSGGAAAMVLLLLDHGADIEAVERNAGKYTPFLNGVQSGSEQVMELLLKRGANINAKTSEGFTPMHVAAYYDQCAAATLLLRHGLSVNARDAHQRTPLMIAAQQGNMKMVKFLLDHQADVDAVGDFGVTALKVAINCGRFEIADHLTNRATKR